MVEYQTARRRLFVRILKQLPVQILLTLRFVREKMPQIVKPSQAFRRYNHHRTHRAPVVVGAGIEDASRAGYHGLLPTNLRVVIVVLRVWIWNGVLAAQFLQLTVVLQEYNRAVEQYDHEQVDVDGDLEVFDGCLVLWVQLVTGENLVNSQHGVPYHGYNVEREEEEEEQEVLMVLVAQAIVYERAVMIETLDTLVAVVTMHGILRSEILTVNADVIQM